MHKFVRSLITEWRQLGLPFADETFVVAVSGGADSLSLMLALDELRRREKLRVRFVAAHFNHKLRGHESDADEEFVKQLAEQKGFELAAGHGPIAEEGNVEQNARNARYAYLSATAENLNAYGVLAAHTMNDQAETFLLNLIRGSGIDGLRAMPPIRDLESGQTTEIDAFLPFAQPPKLIRPLLRWARRSATENFCRELGVEFRFDTMNEDMSFKRVRIRKILLPMLADFNPKIIETLARTAELMSQSDGLLPPSLATVGDSESSEEPKPIQHELAIKDIKNLDPGEMHRALRSWLKACGGSLRSITLKHVQAIERLIQSPKSGRLIELPGGKTVRRHGGRLAFGKIKVDK